MRLKVPDGCGGFGYQGEDLDLSKGYVDTVDSRLAADLQSHGFTPVDADWSPAPPSVVTPPSLKRRA
jgi:hypothetical protein